MKKRIFILAAGAIFAVAAHLAISIAYAANVTVESEALPPAKWWLICDGKVPEAVLNWSASIGSTIFVRFVDQTEKYYFAGNRCVIKSAAVTVKKKQRCAHPIQATCLPHTR